MSVYLVASRQNVRLRQSLGHSICHLPLSRDDCYYRPPTLLQIPGQRSEDKIRQGYIIVSRCSAEVHQHVVILPAQPAPKVPGGALTRWCSVSSCSLYHLSFSSRLFFSSSSFFTKSISLRAKAGNIIGSCVVLLKKRIFQETVKSRFYSLVLQFLYAKHLHCCVNPVKFKCILPRSSITQSKLHFKPLSLPEHKFCA